MKKNKQFSIEKRTLDRIFFIITGYIIILSSFYFFSRYVEYKKDIEKIEKNELYIEEGYLLKETSNIINTIRVTHSNDENTLKDRVREKVLDADNFAVKYYVSNKKILGIESIKKDIKKFLTNLSWTRGEYIVFDIAGDDIDTLSRYLNKEDLLEIEANNGELSRYILKEYRDKKEYYYAFFYLNIDLGLVIGGIEDISNFEYYQKLRIKEKISQGYLQKGGEIEVLELNKIESKDVLEIVKKKLKENENFIDNSFEIVEPEFEMGSRYIKYKIRESGEVKDKLAIVSNLDIWSWVILLSIDNDIEKYKNIRKERYKKDVILLILKLSMIAIVFYLVSIFIFKSIFNHLRENIKLFIDGVRNGKFSKRIDIEELNEILEEIENFQNILYRIDQNYEKILNATPAIMILFDKNSRVDYVNKKMINSWGTILDNKEILGLSVGDIKLFKEIGIDNYVYQVFADKNVVEAEVSHRHQEEFLFFNLKFIPIMDEGEIDKILMLVDDITKNRKDEISLAKYKIIVEKNPYGVMISNTLGEIVYMNVAFKKMHNVSEGLDIFTRREKFYEDETFDIMEIIQEKLLINNELSRVEIVRRRYNMESFISNTNFELIADSVSGETYVVEIVEDIDQYEKLKERYRVLREIIDESEIYFAKINLKGFEFEYISDNIEDLGYRAEKIMKKYTSITQIIEKRDLKWFISEIRENRETGKDIHRILDIMDIDGKKHKFDVYIYFEKDHINNNYYINCIFIKVKERAVKYRQECIVEMKFVVEEMDRISNSIKTVEGYSEVLLEKDLTSEINDMAYYMKDESERNIESLHDISCFFKFRDKNDFEDKVEVDIIKLATELQKEFKEKLEYKQLSWKVSLKTGGNDKIRVNKKYLNEILRVLIRDSIERTEEGYVAFEMEILRGVAIIKISDTGKKQLENLKAYLNNGEDSIGLSLKSGLSRLLSKKLSWKLRPTFNRNENTMRLEVPLEI